MPRLFPFSHVAEVADQFFQCSIFFGKGSENIFPGGATGEPLSEWPAELLDHEGGLAPNDVYGKMFYYLRDLFVDFQKRIQRLSLNVTILASNYFALPAVIPAHILGSGFDRIEVRLTTD